MCQHEPAFPGMSQHRKLLKNIWDRGLTVGCPVVVSPLPREWSCLYRRGEAPKSFFNLQKYFRFFRAQLRPAPESRQFDSVEMASHSDVPSELFFDRRLQGLRRRGLAVREPCLLGS